MLIPYATTLYKGVKRDIFIDPKQARDLRYESRNGFIISSVLSKDHVKLQQAIDAFCTQQIKSIIDRSISRLRTKKITISIPHSDGKTTFDKEVTMSVDDYLDALKFSKKLEYKIGAFDREWGINTVDPRRKIFTLFFNLNLIKYDDGPHIEHVVAHELAHVFFRDHGAKFEDALRQLDSSSRWSQAFFSQGISSVGSSGSITPLIIILVAIVIMYWLYMVGDWALHLIGGNLNGIGGSHPRF